MEIPKGYGGHDGEYPKDMVDMMENTSRIWWAHQFQFPSILAHLIAIFLHYKGFHFKHQIISFCYSKVENCTLD